MNTRLKELVFRDISFYFEKYGLSSLMLYYALKNCVVITAVIAHMMRGWSLGESPDVSLYRLLATSALLVIYNGFTGGILLFSKRPHRAPENWSAIFIPLLAAYFALAYNFLAYMPEWMAENYTPRSWLPFFIVTSVFLGLLGQAIAVSALFYLRRSFAVLVEVRDAIVVGPYSQVRHPIYMGHIFTEIGIVLSNLCPAYMFIATAHIALLAYRARREEKVLAANDPVYKRNMEHTGFLFPKLSAFTSGQPFFSYSNPILRKD